MQFVSKTIQALKNEIKIWALLRGIVVLLPFAMLYLSTHNSIWLQSSVLTMATLIVEEELELTALGVLLHGFIIIAMFYLLFLTQLKPMLYVASCSLAASTIIWITMGGDKLRPLGRWTFIPAIYLATEFASEIKPTILVHQAPHFLPYLLIALLPTLLIAQFDTMRAFYQKHTANYHPLRLAGLEDFGDQNPYVESLIAMVMAVCISAFLVKYFQMENGQWMIWGTASVVTGDISTTPKKFHERVFGVSVGVPLGILIGQFVLSYTPFALTLVICGVFLTLVSFRRYVIAYTLRCFFVVTAIMLVTHSLNAAAQRFTHVVLGGSIGLACVMFCHFIPLVQKNFVRK